MIDLHKNCQHYNDNAKIVNTTMIIVITIFFAVFNDKFDDINITTYISTKKGLCLET